MKPEWSLLPLSLFLAVSVAQEDAELSKEELAATLFGVEASDISDSPLPGVYEVAVGPDVGYITSDGRYLLQGDLYDLSTNENVTETRRERRRVNALAGVDVADMIIFSPEPEDVKYAVTIFTDIDCGYCRQFHSEIAKVNELGIEVRYLFYPRTGPDTDSWSKAEKVWCSGV
ncbi:MAG: thioredoxin fold domain-containing protein, partial [Gammaproteobacteria bacterium]|nr:thioredoxin fold domain-containing protein [Gammaproteobacteria bacterium]